MLMASYCAVGYIPEQVERVAGGLGPAVERAKALAQPGNEAFLVRNNAHC